MAFQVIDALRSGNKMRFVEKINAGTRNPKFKIMKGRGVLAKETFGGFAVKIVKKAKPGQHRGIAFGSHWKIYPPRHIPSFAIKTKIRFQTKHFGLDGF